MIHLFDQFLNQPKKQRYSIIVISFIILFMMSYYFMIKPIKEKYRQECLNQNTLEDELNLLKQKVANYPSEEDLLQQITVLTEQQEKTKMLSMQELTDLVAQKILSNRLKIIDFSRSEDKERINLYYTITGEYFDFIRFFSQFAESNLAISSSEISITRHNDQLIFSLLITLINQSGTY